MSKVVCAALECKYNKNNRCTASSVSLSDGHIHTVHQGYKQIWECKTFEISEEDKKLYEEISLLMNGGKTDHEVC